MTATTGTERSDHPHVHRDGCRHVAILRANDVGHWDNH